MTSETVVFEWLEIEGFRGFARLQRFALDASAIVVSGPNGTGKTSFFDAIQWLLLGSLERLEPWRLRRNTEHVVNKYSEVQGVVATVGAGLRIGNSRVELYRRGRHDSTQFEWRESGQAVFDEEADGRLRAALTPSGRMSVRQALLSSGLLQQDVIRDVLEDKPAARYDQLAAMLGLEAIAGFPAAAKKRANRLAEDGHRARDRLVALESEKRGIDQRITALRERASRAPDVEALRSEASARLERHAGAVALTRPLPLSASEAESLRGSAGLAAEAFAEFLREASEPEPADAKLPLPAERQASEERVESAVAALGKQDQVVAELADRLAKERQLADRLNRLAIDALPLVDSTCPVCSQEINDPEHVRVHLRQLIDQGSPDLAALERDVEEAQKVLQDLRAAEKTARAGLDELASRTEKIRRAEVVAQQRQARLEHVIAQLDERLSLADSEGVARADHKALEAASAALAAISNVAEELAGALKWNVDAAAVAEAQAQLRVKEAQIAEARDLAAAASGAEDEARTLQRAAVRAASSVTSERFETLRPVIQDIYSRLDPHPAFTSLQFSVDVYREKGVASAEVQDEDEGVAADPLLVFSSSQANVVALSAFLALGWAAGDDSMPFLLLDDPLQSLDDVNALGFADLCRHLRSRRQLIVSTHDGRLASLLHRKLAPRLEGERTRALNFVAWSRNGPLVDAEEIVPQLDEGSRRALASGG